MKPKLLFLSQGAPFLPFSGYGHRTLGMLRWLVERFDVDVIYEGQPATDSQNFLQAGSLSSVHAVPAHPGLVARVQAAVGSLPYHHALASNPAMAGAVATRLAQTKYSALWLNKSVHFPLVATVAGRVPVFIDQIAAEPTVWSNLADNDPRHYARWFFRWNGRKVMAFDIETYRVAAGVICISAEDQATTEAQYPGTRTIVIPSGIDPGYYAPDPKARPDPRVLLFSGTGAVRNVEAVVKFKRDIMPRLLRADPAMRLLWIGNVTESARATAGAPWLDFTGFVDHVPPFFNRGVIFVAPFTMGEGMKTKIVEALAMGKVVVASPVGVQGIEVKGLPFVRVCSTDEEFATAIMQLKADPGLSALGRAAREWAVETHAWTRLQQPLGQFLEDRMKNGAGPRSRS